MPDESNTILIIIVFLIVLVLGVISSRPLRRSAKMKKPQSPEGSIKVELINNDELHVTESKLPVSIAYPNKISKGVDSLFLVKIFAEKYRIEAEKSVLEELSNLSGSKDQLSFHTFISKIELGLTVVVKIKSSVIEFSETDPIKLEWGINTFRILGYPKKDCNPGIHIAVLSIIDKETGKEKFSESFEVRVVDYAFDHVSRPLLSSIGSAISGLGSVVMFILTFLEQIDKTFGLASGGAAAFVAMTLYWRYLVVFRQPKKHIDSVLRA